MKTLCLLLLLLIPLGFFMQDKRLFESSQHKKTVLKKKIYSISCETYECANCVKTYKTYAHPSKCHARRYSSSNYRISAWSFLTTDGKRVDANSCHALSNEAP